MSESKTWYYYLHTNGDLIGKNPVVVDADPGYFDSPFVRRTWRVDLTDRGSCWRMVLEALAAGAQIDRIKGLAAKWGLDQRDSVEFLTRAMPTKEMQKGLEIFVKEILGLDVDAYWKWFIEQRKAPAKGSHHE